MINDILKQIEEGGWVGSMGETVRDNLIWYKDNGSDHGDLVIAEEAIHQKHSELLLDAHQSLVKEIIEMVEDTNLVCAACRGTKCNHTLWCQDRKRLRTLLEKLLEGK